MPDREQQIALGGPLKERTLRRVVELAGRLILFPWRVITLPLRQLRGEVRSLRSAAVESLAYVGVELRRLGDLIERGNMAPPAEEPTGGEGDPERELTFGELAGIDAPGPVLVVGARGRQIARSLASLGYEVELAPAGLEPDSQGREFAAALYLSDGPVLDPAEIERIEDRLAGGAPLVITLRSESNGASSSGSFRRGE